MNPLYVLLLRGLDVNQRFISEGKRVLRASLLQELNRWDAFLSVCIINNWNILTGQESISGDYYIRLSPGASLDSMTPWEFFCWVSCRRVTYSEPFSSVWKLKESRRRWCWNSRPRETKWMDRWYQTHSRRTRGENLAARSYEAILDRSSGLMTYLFFVGLEAPQSETFSLASHPKFDLLA